MTGGLLEEKATTHFDYRGRAWNPALHPRDSKGRFIETGGVARAWGRGLVRVLKALPGERVLVEGRDGTRVTIPAKQLTMVTRPNGGDPTARKDSVMVADRARAADPSRGNGHTTPDHGTLDDTHLEEPTGPPARDPIDATTLPHLTNEQLAAILDSSAVRGHYDEQTLTAIATEYDNRAPLANLPKALADAPNDAARTAVADLAVPAHWLAWVNAGERKAETKAREASKEKQAWEAYLEYAYSRYRAANEATKGRMFKREFYGEGRRLLPKTYFGGTRGPDTAGEMAFFTGTKAATDDRVRNKYASEELQQWFAEHGYTMSFDEFKRAYHGGSASGGHHGYRSEHG